MSPKALVALVVAAACLTGCNVKLAGVTPKPSPVAVATGQVQLAFRGLAAYQTLDAQRQVARVEIALNAGGTTRHEVVAGAQLRQSEVAVSFRNVRAGLATLAVRAFDASGEALGDGTGSATVEAGRTAQAHVRVQLRPTTTGNLRALIDFTEAACNPRYDAFDTDGDGRLDRAEFRVMWNQDHAIGPLYAVACAPAYPIDPPMPIDPVMQQFTSLDTDGDQSLSAGELCAYAYAVPGPLPVDPPVTVEPVMPIDPPPSAVPVPAPAVSAVAHDFDAMDTNHDGHVSWDEEAAANPELPAGGKTRLYDHFRQVDSNANGTLERDEYAFAK
jgi:Ca2+-binding EF-hand superfamily protein